MAPNTHTANGITCEPLVDYIARACANGRVLLPWSENGNCDGLQEIAAGSCRGWGVGWGGGAVELHQYAQNSHALSRN